MIDALKIRIARWMNLDVFSLMPYFSGLRLLYLKELVSMFFLFLFLVPDL